MFSNCDQLIFSNCDQRRALQGCQIAGAAGKHTNLDLTSDFFNRLDGFIIRVYGSFQEWPGHPAQISAQSNALGDIHTAAQSARGKNQQLWSAAPAFKMASLVGMPQLRKAAAIRAWLGKSPLCISTCDQDVPPAPATSMAVTPASFRRVAVS